MSNPDNMSAFGLVTFQPGETAVSVDLSTFDDNFVERLYENITIMITGVLSGNNLYNIDSNRQSVEIEIEDNDTLELQSVHFAGTNYITRDPGENASWTPTSNHWEKGKQLGEYAPVAYSSDKTLSINDAKWFGIMDSADNLTFSVVYNIVINGKKYTSTSSDLYCTNLPDLSGLVAEKKNWSLSGSMGLSQSFVSIFGVQRAFYDENFELSWKLIVSEDSSIDKQRESGVSTSCLYVTYAEPAISPIYHSVIHIGTIESAKVCTGVEENVFNAIWTKFQSLNIHKININDGRIVQDELLTYYGKASDPSNEAIIKSKLFVTYDSVSGIIGGTSPSKAREISELVGYPTGGLTYSLLQYTDGTCGVWQNFFVDVLSRQGIVTTPLGIEGNTILGFQVKPIPGQGTATPKETIWNDHAVVQYGTKVYDPSYGVEYGEKDDALEFFMRNGVLSIADSLRFATSTENIDGYKAIYVPASGVLDYSKADIYFKWN